jgi:hypothetical protein
MPESRWFTPFSGNVRRHAAKLASLLRQRETCCSTIGIVLAPSTSSSSSPPLSASASSPS